MSNPLAQQPEYRSVAMTQRQPTAEELMRMNRHDQQDLNEQQVMVRETRHPQEYSTKPLDMPPNLPVEKLIELAKDRSLFSPRKPYHRQPNGGRLYNRYGNSFN